MQINVYTYMHIFVLHNNIRVVLVLVVGVCTFDLLLENCICGHNIYKI